MNTEELLPLLQEEREMTFGDKLKSLRVTRDWTQPEAAAAIGVEQSYLSKLENGSIPSAEVFRRLLDGLQTSMEEVLEGLDTDSLNKLRRIAEVDDYLADRARVSVVRHRRYITALIATVALGAALIYAGLSGMFFPEVVYGYAAVTQDREAEVRSDEVYLTHRYRGYSFTLSTDSGTLTYNLEDERSIDRWQNKLVTFVGVFAATFGFLGLIVASPGKRPDGA